MFKFLLGFRKFTILVLYMSIMVIFRLKDYINGAEFSENLQLAVVAYMGANIGEHIVNVTKDWLKKKEPIKITKEWLKEQLAKLEADKG